nr:hypothetical protein CFP56_57826 [Quercus suber]
MADIALPTIAEILASSHVLSAPKSFTKVVKVGEHFAVKYGRRISLIEAQNLEFLANTAVPVPKIYGAMTDPGTNTTFIIMEYLEGQTLNNILPSLTPDEKEDVFSQIQQALVDLRNLEAPDYLGSIGRKAFGDGIFYTDPLDPVTCGPFEDQAAMNVGIVRRLRENCGPEHVELLQKVVDATLKGHRTVFTHADLQPRNIMVRRTGATESGSRVKLDVIIIDWEMSGWYPEYFEFCSATVWDSLHPEWLGAVQKMMTIYPAEYLMMKMIRSHVFLLG